MKEKLPSKKLSCGVSIVMKLYYVKQICFRIIPIMSKQRQRNIESCNARDLRSRERQPKWLTSSANQKAW